jgi:phage tail-like protein
VVIKQITEVSGLKIDQDVVEFKQGNDSGKLIVKKLPGRPKAGEVTLTRGLTHDSSFEDWIRDSRFGKLPDARKGGAIIVFDYEGAAIKRYKLINARLMTLGLGTRKADGNILTEKLILTHEGCEAGQT